MNDLFEKCRESALVGVIVDFSEDVETYIVGTPADIKKWAYSGCLQKTAMGLMRHSNKAGNLVKDINERAKGIIICQVGNKRQNSFFVMPEPE